MKPDPILAELWRTKDDLSERATADPKAYFRALKKREESEEKSGRKVVRSAEEAAALADKLRRISTHHARRT